MPALAYRDEDEEGNRVDANRGDAGRGNSPVVVVVVAMLGSSNIGRLATYDSHDVDILGNLRASVNQVDVGLRKISFVGSRPHCKLRRSILSVEKGHGDDIDNKTTE